MPQRMGEGGEEVAGIERSVGDVARAVAMCAQSHTAGRISRAYAR